VCTFPKMVVGASDALGERIESGAEALGPRFPKRGLFGKVPGPTLELSHTISAAASWGTASPRFAHAIFHPSKSLALFMTIPLYLTWLPGHPRECHGKLF
jgi:hypothetical protein